MTNTQAVSANLLDIVVAELNERGIESYNDYPGYVAVVFGGTRWAFGTANGQVWEGDDTDEHGQTSQYAVTTVPADCADPVVIADAILKALGV